MREDTRVEFEEFINTFFENNEITVFDYSKTEAGIHVGLYFKYSFPCMNSMFIDQMPFHFNLFYDEDGGTPEFKPLFEQTYMITDIRNPAQHANADAKKEYLPFLTKSIRFKWRVIKQKMIEMDADNKFD